jgi:adenosylhomocysteinase
VREFVFTSESVAEGRPDNVAGEAGPEVHGAPEVIDRQIARLKAGTLGVEIDQLTDEQERYLSSWDEGT